MSRHFHRFFVFITPPLLRHYYVFRHIAAIIFAAHYFASFSPPPLPPATISHFAIFAFITPFAFAFFRHHAPPPSMPGFQPLPLLRQLSAYFMPASPLRRHFSG
jgi:hypothetical protein